MGRSARHRFEGHVPRRESLRALPQEIRRWPDRHHLLDHGSDHRLSRLDALRSVEIRQARLSAHRRDRAREIRDHRQRGHARQHSLRAARGAGQEYPRTMAASSPLKQLGTVVDIGYAALYLASTEARYITGQSIVADGGHILP